AGREREHERIAVQLDDLVGQEAGGGEPFGPAAADGAGGRALVGGRGAGAGTGVELEDVQPRLHVESVDAVVVIVVHAPGAGVVAGAEAGRRVVVADLDGVVRVGNVVDVDAAGVPRREQVLAADHDLVDAAGRALAAAYRIDLPDLLRVGK